MLSLFILHLLAAPSTTAVWKGKKSTSYLLPSSSSFFQSFLCVSTNVLSTYPCRPHSHIKSENKYERVFNTSLVNTQGVTQPKCGSAAVTTPPSCPFDVGFDWGERAQALREAAPPAAPDVSGHSAGERPWPGLELHEWSICCIVEDPSHEPIVWVWLWMWDITEKLRSYVERRHISKTALPRASWYI